MMDMVHDGIAGHDIISPICEADVGLSLGADLARLDSLLTAYCSDAGSAEATAQALLSAVENLRRFVMKPRILRDGLQRARGGGETLGRRLGQALFGMIAATPASSLMMGHAERLSLDRTSRRAIGCIAYLGTVDAAFIIRDGQH